MVIVAHMRTFASELSTFGRFGVYLATLSSECLRTASAVIMSLICFLLLPFLRFFQESLPSCEAGEVISRLLFYFLEMLSPRPKTNGENEAKGFSI